MQKNIKAKQICGLVGALKSQFMYQNSEMNKRRKQGVDFSISQDIIEPDNMLFLVVKELEEAIKNIEDTTKNLTFEIKIKEMKNENIDTSNCVDLPDIIMPAI